MHVRLGGYHLRDIKIVAAFDVNENKIGKDVAEAIYAAPNNTDRFAKVPKTGVKVSRGPLLDGVNKYTAPLIPIKKDSETRRRGQGFT
jgi:myo-inositol-1-phosphate synthase